MVRGCGRVEGRDTVVEGGGRDMAMVEGGRDTVLEGDQEAEEKRRRVQGGDASS